MLTPSDLVRFALAFNSGKLLRAAMVQLLQAGELLGGMVASLMMFPEHGIVVAAITNTSYADTSGVALKIAEAFAEREKRPSPKP